MFGWLTWWLVVFYWFVCVYCELFVLFCLLLFMYNVVVFGLVICCLDLRVWLFSYWLVGFDCLFCLLFMIEDVLCVEFWFCVLNAIWYLCFGLCLFVTCLLLVVLWCLFCLFRLRCCGFGIVTCTRCLGSWLFGLFYCALRMLCFTGRLACIGCVCLWFVCFCLCVLWLCDLLVFGFVFSLKF